MIRVGAVFWSAYTGCKDYHKAGTEVRDIMEQIDLIKRFQDQYPTVFTTAYSVSDIRSAVEKRTIASLIGIEGGHAIDNSLALLRQFYNLGARYLTLTHSCNTAWADSANDEVGMVHGGLTKFGEEVVLEMNRLGMLVDISHVSAPVMLQVLRISEAPVIFSHSSVFSICPSPRNVPDSILTLLPKKDGIVMINFMDGYILCGEDGDTSKNGRRATLNDVVDHIMYIVEKIGAEYVGLGGDFDGVTELPVGLEDVSTYPVLIAELLDRGLTEAQIIGITGGNFLRVFGKAERVAKSIQARSVDVIEDSLRFDRTCEF
ncbi:dipeptidase 1 (renal) [Blyttiomyces sp. JEL0837]|nr:dipeptidase 1 (renal) [Blyttiomyces sp. JEL0837]